MTEKNIGAENARWDLSFIYSGIDDSRIGEDIAKLVGMMKEFNANYKGNLAEKLAAAITDFSEINMLGNKVSAYLSLKQSLDVADSAVKSKIAETERILNQAQGEYLTFFKLELVTLNDAVWEQFYANHPIVVKHRPWIEHQRMFKPHLLSEPVESALIKRSSFGPDAWHGFFNELSADLEFEFRGEKKTLTEILHLLMESKEAGERFELMKILNNGLGGMFGKYAAQTLYMVTGSGSVEDQDRSSRHPMENRNKLNRIPDTVVDILHRVVENVGGPLTRRYYRLKAAHLGMETLKWSDRNARMPFADSSMISFNEALATVITAYESFSPKLAEFIRGFVSDKWIDAPAVKSKRGGAFNASMVFPGGRPVSFVFLNYLGSNRDVMTLAHELGHAVHGMLAGEAQGTLMSDPEIAFAETASIFGEMTTFNFLKKRLIGGDEKALLALLMDKIDDIINTVIRQIGFSNFERRIHGINPSYIEWKKPKKLSVEELNNIWLETLKPLYGEEGEIFTYENTEHLWAYVSHFHEPFYVYGYAFGELLAHSIYSQQARFGTKFETLYLDMLRSGGTKDVVELLEPFGFDPMDENFWIEGINISLRTMIEEAERLSCNMGIFI